MKLLNPIHCDDSTEKIGTRLLVMPQDSGIWFGVANASRVRPEKKFAILRDHFEPWRDGNVDSVRNRELAEAIECGCRRIIGDDHDICELLFKTISGVRSMDFQEICVCMPSAWSLIGRRGQREPQGRPRKRRIKCSERLIQRINTQALVAPTEGADFMACLDATAAYLLDDGDWQRDAPIGQRCRRLHHRAHFILADRDKIRIIKNGLRKVWDSPAILWASDFSPLSHVSLKTDAVVVDIDRRSVRVHWNSKEGETAVLRRGFGSDDFLPRLSARLGEFPFFAAEQDDVNRQKFMAKARDGGVPRMEDLEFKPTNGCSSATIEKALAEMSEIFWSELLIEIEKGMASTGKSRRLIVIGDSPITARSLCKAASPRWQTEIQWSSARPPETRRNDDFSARGAIRATELFYRAPFEDVPLTNPTLYRAQETLKKTGAVVGNALLFLICAASAALVEKVARRGV